MRLARICFQHSYIIRWLERRTSASHILWKTMIGSVATKCLLVGIDKCKFLVSMIGTTTQT